MSQYILHNRLGSGGLVVEAALAMHGAEYRAEDLDFPVSTPLPESFRSVNPWRQIPVLDLPDGTRMTESAAMLIHLGEAFPDASVTPYPDTPEWTQFLRWTLFLATNVYDGILRRTYPDRIIDDPAQHDAIRDAANRHMKSAFAMLEGLLEPTGFLLGPRLSTVDVYLAMLYAWFDKQHTLPRCTAVIDAVRADPAAGPVWVRHYDRKR